MSGGEDQTLIGSEHSIPGTYNTDNDKEDQLNGNGAEEDKSKQATVKRERLQRNPSLEKVDEDHEQIGKPTTPKSKRSFGCSDFSFGVKSYMHHFYSTPSYKDPEIYEDEDDFRYLLHPHPRRRYCTSIWWKVFVWIGANFLVFGIIGVLVGYLVPQRDINVGDTGNNFKIIDHAAETFNFNLNVCKLVGLILFCIGGLTLTVALLFPSFLHDYCDDYYYREHPPFKVKPYTDEKPPLSPVNETVPASTTLSNVQPNRKSQEAVYTQEGMVPF